MIQKRFSLFPTTEHLIIAVLLSIIVHGLLFFVPVHPIKKPPTSLSNLSVKLQPLTNQANSTEKIASAEKMDEPKSEYFADVVKRLQKIEAQYALQNSDLPRAQEQQKASIEQLKSAFAEPNSSSAEHANYEPVLVYRPHLRYPPAAYMNGIEGKVMIGANITANGSLTDISIKQSSGHRILDYAASKSALSWRFIPPPKGTTVAVEIPFVFEGCYKQTL